MAQIGFCGKQNENCSFFNGLLRIISDVEKEPTSPDALSAWNRRDEKAYAKINQQLCDALLSLVMSKGTAKVSWEALKIQYERRSMQNVIRDLTGCNWC